jgi:putative transposase
MSQSLSQIYIHTIFSTKGCNPWINEAIAPHLHAYMASILNPKLSLKQ